MSDNAQSFDVEPDLNDFEFDFDVDFNLRSPAEYVLDQQDEIEDLDITTEEEKQFWSALKTRVSTDPIIELTARDRDIVNKLRKYELIDSAPLYDNSQNVNKIDFDKIYNEYDEKEGDKKIDLYFVGSDIDLSRNEYEDMSQTRLVNDFVLRMGSVCESQRDERFEFVDDLLINFKDNKDIHSRLSKNSFEMSKLNRKREKERVLGSVKLGTSQSHWKDFKQLLFKPKRSNLKNVLLDSLNLEENESFRLIFSYNQRIIESILVNVEETFMLSLLKYHSMISKQLMHVSTQKRKRNTYRVMTGGSTNSITILSQGDTVRNEKSAIKYLNAYIVSPEYAQIIKNMQGSFCKYHYYDIDSQRILIISNWYTVTPRLLSQYSESLVKVLSFSLYTCLNGEPHTYKERFRNSSFMSMMAGLSKNREVVNFLSLSRYVSASLLSEYSNIPNLIHEKLPKRISSMFCDYVISTYLTFLRKPLIEIEWNKDSIGKQFLNQDDFTFKCFLPMMQFETVRIQDFLSDTYLVNLCCDDLVESNHSFVEFTETLKKFEDMRKTDPDYFYCDPDIIETVSSSIIYNVLSINNINLSEFKFEDRRLIAHCTPNGVLSEGARRALKLYDRILEEVLRTERELTLKDMLKYHRFERFKFTMVEKKQKADPREIFKTDLKGIAALKIVESYIDKINRGLFSETISMGGDQKYFRTQNETHKIISSNRDEILKEEPGRYIFSRTSDASKWSTGDNMDSLISCFKPLENYMDDDIYLLCEKSLSGIKDRELVLENKLYQPGKRTKNKIIAQSAHLRNAVNKVFDIDENPILHSGWPQGFYNKLSTYKHFVAQTIAIIFFKLEKYKRDGQVSGVIDQSCHSDDYTYIADFDDERDLRLWEKCIFNAKRICCIRENEKKSSIGKYCREFLSFFVVMGSVFIPHSKYITGLDKDVPGTSYTDDIYASMARVRECYRIGVSEVWCQFAMQLCNHRIQRMYAIAPNMKNYNPSINNYCKPCEYGGYFLSHPIFLLFFGVKSNNFRLYNREGVTDLLKIIPPIYRLKEEDAEEIDDLRNLESFFLFPKYDLKYGSDVKRIVKDLKAVKSETDFKYHERMLNKYLEYNRSKELLTNRLFEKSGRRMYAKIPKGMMEVVIHRSSSGICFNSETHGSFSLMQLFQFIDSTKVEETPENRALVEMALFSNSNILAVLQELYNSELDIADEVIQANKNISYMAHINLRNPGNFEVRNINESLAMICPALSETIKDNIKKFSHDSLDADITRMKAIMHSSFGKEQVDSLDELDLMIRFFNTKYPTNKFLMVPDVRLKSGIDNIDLFLKEMLSFRVSPFMYREFNWKPIGKVKDWKDSFIHSSNLLRSLQRSNTYEYLYVLNNIMIHHFATHNEEFESTRNYLKDVILKSDFQGTLITNLIHNHSLEMIASGSRMGRPARSIYTLSKLKIIDNERFIHWYEDQNFPIEYTFDNNDNLFVKDSFIMCKISKRDGITLYCDVERHSKNLLRMIWISQMLLRGERKEDVFSSYVHSFLGKGSICARRVGSVKTEDLIITTLGFKTGYSGTVRWDVVSDMKVSSMKPPNITGFAKSNLNRLYSILNYRVNKTYFNIRDGQIFLADVNSNLKLLDLEICNSSTIRYTGDMKYRRVNLSELIGSLYFDRDNLLQVCHEVVMSVQRFYCSDIQNSLLIKQRLDREDLKGLDDLFLLLYEQYNPVPEFHKNIISKDLIIDDEDQQTRVDDIQLIDFDIVEVTEGFISQRKTKLPWKRFETICSPRLKCKLFNHYIFGKTSWRGASSIYYECHSKLMSKAVREKDEKHANLLKLFLLMMTISKLNVVETQRSVDSDANVIIKLLNYGGLGRKGKFWADIFREVGISSNEEYL